MQQHVSKLARDPQALGFLGAVLAGGVVAALLTVGSWHLALAVTVVVAGVLVFAWQPLIGLYAMTVLYPFINLQFVYGALNVPYVDIIAILAFAGWLLRSLWEWWMKGVPLTWKQFPGLVFFLAFVVASFLSIFNAEDKLLSLKYVLRPLSFFYLMFVIFPLNTIKTPEILKRVFYVFYAVGIVTALNGLVGFLTYPADSILSKRAVPAAIFGVFPYGTSHNLIAEVLVSVIPIGLYLTWLCKESLNRKLVFLGTLCMLGVNLLTFSRTGWIVALLELFVFGYALYQGRFKDSAKGLFFLGVLFTPLMVYMFIFSSQSFVQSSDENRYLLLDIAYDTWHHFPMLGAGPGRFQEFVAKNAVYMIEFGAPSEAHGFIQKIAAEEGVLGLGTYVLLLGFVIHRVWKAYVAVRSDQVWGFTLLACLSLTLGSIVFQLFQTNYFVSKMWFPLGLAMAAAELALRQLKKTV